MGQPRPDFFAGTALMAAGLLVALVNAALTPLLVDRDPVEAALSQHFLQRQSLLTLACALSMIGVLGLFRLRAPGALAGAAYALALVGSGVLLAHQWMQLFMLREVALYAPETARAIESQRSWSDIGAVLAFLTFGLGWLLLAIVLFFSKPGARLAACLIILGLAAPMLLASFGVSSHVAASVVLGAGWMLLGWGMLRPPSTAA